MLHEFRMPDAGEGLTEAEVLSWHVAVGDVVRVNQVLLEVETAKAAVELPSPYAGTVVALLAEPGEVVPVGQPIIRIEDEVALAGGAAGPASDAGAGEATAPAARGADPATTAAAPRGGTPADAGAPGAGTPGEAVDPGAATPAAAGSSSASQILPGTSEGRSAGGGAAEPAGGSSRTRAEASAASPAAPAAPAAPQRQAVLVGYGVREAGAPARRPRATPHGAEHAEPGPPGVGVRPVRHGGLEQARAVEERLATQPVRAKPPVRKLARDLGVDLATVAPTGPGGTITHQDVTTAAAAAASHERVPMSHVARMMARAMQDSASSAVHVTEWVDVDVTAMTALIRAARQRDDLAGISITPLTFAALGLARAARQFPMINASMADDGEHVLVHRAVHLGIAVDSPRGLVVPRIPDAGELDLRGMGDALARLVETARAGRSRPEDLRGSTITITNVGVFGVDGGTPIINPGEVAILALGRVLARPWIVDGAVVARDVVTLALSFDHRIVDGALGSRVLRSVADFMADPATALALDP